MKKSALATSSLTTTETGDASENGRYQAIKKNWKTDDDQN